MSVGVWEPKKPAKVDAERLRRLLALARRRADPDDLQASMTEDEVRADANLMALDQGAWESAEALDDEEIIDLIRFFTLAEMQLPNWRGGETSPVIYLAKILRARKAFTPELRKWIKRNTDNRYLPYGAVL